MNKTTLIAGTLVLAGVATGAIVSLEEEKITLVDPQVIVWQKPTTDEEWAEDVKKEQLHIRFDYQLQEMKKDQEERLPAINKLYDKATLYPDAIRWELMEQGIVEPELTKEVNDKIAQIKWAREKTMQSIERIDKEIELRSKMFNKVDRTADILKIQPSTEKEREELNKLKK